MMMRCEVVNSMKGKGVVVVSLTETDVLMT